PKLWDRLWVRRPAAEKASLINARGQTPFPPPPLSAETPRSAVRHGDPTEVRRPCTHKSRLFGNRWLPRTTCAVAPRFRRFSAAVATNQKLRRSPRSGRAVQHRQWDRALEEKSDD